MKTRETWMLTVVLAFSLGAAVPGSAQEPNAQYPNPQYQQNIEQPNQPAPPPSQGWRRAGENMPPDAPPPISSVTVPAGTWITIRVDEPISSDRNEQGDTFTGSLAQPLVASGLVVARRGQTVLGVVSEAEKAGRVKGTSRLGLQLTGLSLVDGRQVQVRTSLMQRRGNTSTGRDAAAIGTTTGVGAAIGAVADGGFGAGMGAIAGAAASTIGVLATRGHPTIVYPEMLLTFRLDAPLTFSIENTADAFQPVTQEDYDQGGRQQLRYGPSLSGAAPQAPPSYYGGNYGGYYGGYYGGLYGGWGGYPWYYPGFYGGPGFYLYSGPGFFGGYHRRGFRR